MTGALSEEVRKQWEVQIPLRRGGTPEDVANVATFLASDLSSYVSGQTIHVCGGMTVVHERTDSHSLHLTKAYKA